MEEPSSAGYRCPLSPADRQSVPIRHGPPRGTPPPARAPSSPFRLLLRACRTHAAAVAAGVALQKRATRSPGLLSLCQCGARSATLSQIVSQHVATPFHPIVLT